MKPLRHIIPVILLFVALLVVSGCTKKLDSLAENRTYTGGTDYTITSNMIQPLYGVYSRLNGIGWNIFPLLTVRGDDVNKGGLGDQSPLGDIDYYHYDNTFWMLDADWQELFGDIITANSAMEQIALYKKNAKNGAPLADQYIAEAQVMRCWWLFWASRAWGSILVPPSSDPSVMFTVKLSSKDSVMAHISSRMDEAIPNLPDKRPNQRTDIPGGLTKYTALAVKALANLELKKYQAVADATGKIIQSGLFSLEPDFYNLFKLKGKLNNENVWELNFTDFGTPSGDSYNYLWDFFGPQSWTPKVSTAGGGWGFWEPSFKYVKFMLDRGENVRLETTVIFTQAGIDSLKKVAPQYANSLPAFVSNTTRDGDVFNNGSRQVFYSGKMYLPSDMLTTGRTSYSSNKDFQIIRYSQILLMYAEALTQGATGTAGTADDAVNAVRLRAGLSAISGVTNAQVMDEKFAELATEWGDRYYDMVRLGNTAALSYDGRTFTSDKTFLPYPLAETDVLPQLLSK